MNLHLLVVVIEIIEYSLPVTQIYEVFAKVIRFFFALSN